jgi:hypothetical protein
MDDESFVEILARDFHVALAAGHAFAAIFNLRRRNYVHAGIRVLASAYDAWASLQHHKEFYEKR